MGLLLQLMDNLPSKFNSMDFAVNVHAFSHPNTVQLPIHYAIINGDAEAGDYYEWL